MMWRHLAVLSGGGRRSGLVPSVWAAAIEAAVGVWGGAWLERVAPRPPMIRFRMEVTPVFHLNTGVFFCEDTFL